MNAATFAVLPAALDVRYVELEGRDERRDARILCDEERERANRFRFARDRRRFVAAHAALRRALAEHTDLAAGALRFRQGAFGKPELLDRPSPQFNLSHSGALALLAIGRRCPVGVDVEQLRPVPDALALASACFTRQENEALAALPLPDRDHAFLTCWTRKEACLKAIGTGLMLAPDSFEVGLEAEPLSVSFQARDQCVCVALQPAPGREGSVGSVAQCHAPFVGANR